MRTKFGLRHYAGLTTFVACIAAALFIVPAAFGSGAAAYTTYSGVDKVAGGCLDSPNGVDCNNYTAKDKVYVNGGPTNGHGLPAGTYYFAVIDPGFQHDGWIDGHEGNLSDTFAATGGKTFPADAGSGDSYLCRELTVDGNGGVTYTPAGGCTTGSHASGTAPDGHTVTQLMPYDDTSNNGGVYIMAVCRVGATSASDCKFDMFKIKKAECVTDCGAKTAADLVVTKDANPTYTRTFTWTISKTVDGKSSVSYKPTGQQTTLTYVVGLAKGTGVDSAWSVSGDIEVFNPNDTDPVTLRPNADGGGLTDSIDDAHSSCSISSGSYTFTDITNDVHTVTGISTDGGSIPANTSVDFPYTCTYSAAFSSTEETNTATAYWNAQTLLTDGALAAGSSAGTAGVHWDDPTTTVHDSVNLADVYSTVPAVIPSFDSYVLQAGDSLPGVGPYSSGQTFTYHYVVTVPHGCLEIDNTASFKYDTSSANPDGSAATAATICRTPPATGALTIGFWQNKNGQAIITGQAKAGTCASATWLRQFAPFQDLSATATCAQVGTYDLNVFKAATCSGTAAAPCNAMLKAQMLATAFDVYFSDSVANGFGGNKINAPHPIGSVTIDLTNICKMIDGAGGTATCGNAYEDASSAFDNNASLTVLQMLSAAAGHSNAGGGTWYGNVKATQVLAKDAFDAVNNQVAFSI
jgi:hypothetical protein